jgi:putative transcriptional regulator
MSTVANRIRSRAAVVAVMALLAAPAAAPWAQMAPAAADGLAGKLLVATPQMPDPRFARTVIFMVKHDASGAMGLVLNRPMGEIPVTSLLEELGIEGVSAEGDIRLHYGGPVDLSRGMVLHSPDYVGDETLVVNGSVALTAEREIVRAIATGAGPRRSLVTFGYAGWGAGQLEAEIANGGWVSVPADEALVFDNDYDAKWRRAIGRHAIEL